MRKLLFLLTFIVACNGIPQNIIDAIETPVSVGPTPLPTVSVVPSPILPTLTPVAIVTPPEEAVATVAATPTKLVGKPFPGPCREVRRYSRNWRVDHFLWKPEAEHVGKPVAIFQLSQQVLVQELTKDKKTVIKNLPFRSFGSAGYAYQDYVNTGLGLKKKYGSIWVHSATLTQCTDYYQADPSKRSDGLNK